jgi:CubicO group peptidase (beta-lactamase class C family)
MLVAHRGRLVLEEYFFGYDRETPHDIRSAGKTFSAVMLGAVQRQGVPVGPETRLYDLLRGRGPFAHPDPRKSHITLAHLMTHSAGLACNDNDEASPGEENRMQSQKTQPDWWKYTLDLPMAFDPGVRYAYCSANTNLVGAALAGATGTWLPALFDRTIAKPLGFGRYFWNLMPTGEGYLGGGAFVRPRDLLKVGQAYLDGGVWNGRRIATPDWVRRSTTPRMKVTPATTGLSQEDFENFYGEGADALAWHMAPITVNGRRYRGYEASGNGGQLLIVFPELDLTAVFTGGNYGQGGIWGRWRQQIIGDLIVAKLREGR